MSSQNDNGVLIVISTSILNHIFHLLTSGGLFRTEAGIGDLAFRSSFPSLLTKKRTLLLFSVVRIVRESIIRIPFPIYQLYRYTYSPILHRFHPSKRFGYHSIRFSSCLPISIFEVFATMITLLIHYLIYLFDKEVNTIEPF
jgi:hypothetical protein